MNMVVIIMSGDMSAIDGIIIV